MWPYEVFIKCDSVCFDQNVVYHLFSSSYSIDILFWKINIKFVIMTFYELE